MARNFNGTTQALTHADITAARFLRLSAWSVGCFFRVETTTNDNNSPFSKWGAVAADQVFQCRVDFGAAPQSITVFTNAGAGSGSTTAVVALNTWYLCVVTNDGVGNTTSLGIYLLDMAGTVLANNVAGDYSTQAATLTAAINFGTGGDTTGWFDGDLAHEFYLSGRELSLAEIQAILRNPARALERFKGLPGVALEYYVPILGLTDPEPDYSGNQQNFALTASPTVSPNPPVKARYRHPSGWMGAFAAAAGGGGPGIMPQLVMPPRRAA